MFGDQRHYLINITREIYVLHIMLIIYKTTNNPASPTSSSIIS